MQVGVVSAGVAAETNAMCRPGFLFTGAECTVLDSCVAFPDACGENERCEARDQGTHDCLCVDGFFREGGACVAATASR